MRDLGSNEKALAINLDESVYGTFAEIGAGQEVARHFFQAGKASSTVAKSISAYDMTFSDEIYGKESRYVSQSRLMRMLDHEFSLLQERLRAKRGDSTRFFAFADTVATASQDDGQTRSHGWMGVRFQLKPGGAYNDIVLHVKLWDRFRLQQQDALGLLGVNLLHLAFFPPERPEDRIAALLDNLNTKRIEVNMIRFDGPDLHHLDNRLLSLELVKQHLTEAVLFGPGSEILHAADSLFRRPVMVQRGTYRPVTNGNLEIAAKVLAQFKKHELVGEAEPRVLFEITMASLAADGGLVNDEDFLHRVDTLAALGQEVLISNFRLFYQMKSFLRQNTDGPIGIVVGAQLLAKMFDESFYKELPGGILEGMSRLFDDRTRVFVFPDKDNTSCSTASTFHPGANLEFLYRHLFHNGWITDALDCDSISTAISSGLVREMLEKRNPDWRKYVPAKAARLIEERQLFGFRP